MVWDAMGAIFGIFAFVLTVFLEWPKLIARVRGIPPILVSIAAALFFAGIGYLSILALIPAEIFSSFRYILLAINVASNIVVLVIANDMMKKDTDGDYKSLVFFMSGLFMYYPVILIFLNTFNKAK